METLDRFVEHDVWKDLDEQERMVAATCRWYDEGDIDIHELRNLLSHIDREVMYRMQEFIPWEVR